MNTTVDLSPLQEAVVAEAMSWKHTPFEHFQRCKGAGVDCGQYLIAVYSSVGLMPDIYPPYYPPDFHRHSSMEWYKNMVEEWADEVEWPQPADIVLYRFPDAKVYHHGGIVLSWPKIIHAFRGRRIGVIETDGTQGILRPLPRKFFRPKGILAEKI